MENNTAKIIAELDDEIIKYTVFQLNEKSDYEILIKKISRNPGVKKGNVIDINNTSKFIIKDLEEIEKKLDKIFSGISIVVNQKEILCTNCSGFKKLNGSKVEKRDLDYILNETKSSIIENQKKNSIIHILNANFVLDKTKQEKIPLNIFGDNLSLHMTFISLPKNNLKNINSLFQNCDLNIDRVISKPFAFGINFLKEKKDVKNFLIINLDNVLTSVSLYEDSSPVFLKTFPFGTSSIYNDISQLCSLSKKDIELIIEEFDFLDDSKNNSAFIQKKFFKDSKFIKLSVKHLKDIMNARIDEITDYIFNNNKNLKHINNKITKIFIFFENHNIHRNLSKLFENSLIANSRSITIESLIRDDDYASHGAAELLFKGWDKEAIPTTNKKKSMISRFFSRFF